MQCNGHPDPDFWMAALQAGFEFRLPGINTCEWNTPAASSAHSLSFLGFWDSFLGWHIINLSLTVLICFLILWGLDWLTVCDWYCPVVGAARKWLAHYRLIGQEWQQSHPGAQLPTRSLNYLTQAGQTLLWKDFVGFSNVLSLDRCGEYEDTNLWAQ